MNDLVVMKEIGGKKIDYLFQEIRIQLSHKLWLDGWILPKKKIMINNFADNGGPFIEDRIGLLFFFLLILEHAS